MNEESNAISAYRVRIGSDCLARHAEGFFEYLRQLGYSPRTASEKCDLLARLGRWLDNRASMEASFDEATLDLFHRSLNRAGHCRRGEIATGRMLLQYLRGLGCVPIPPPPRAEPDAIDQIVRDYGRFLSSERGLAPATLVNYLPVVRGLLTGQFEQGVVNLGELQPADIHRFVLRYAQARSRRTAQLAVTALRSFLRYLRQRGDVATDLASAAPAVACWSLSGLPKFLPADQVKQVVASCDRGTPVGKRDYTILLLLARLGLRAGEVVILTLDDLDWSNGDIIVRGKGQRLARLPSTRRRRGIGRISQRCSPTGEDKTSLPSDTGAAAWSCRFRQHRLYRRPGAQTGRLGSSAQGRAPASAFACHRSVAARGLASGDWSAPPTQPTEHHANLCQGRHRSAAPHRC